MNKTLQIAIENTLVGDNLNKNEKLMTSCVLYKYIIDILENKNNTNSILSLVKSYAGNILNRVLSLKNTYLSYNLMFNEVNLINKDSFYSYTDADVQKVYHLYLDKTKISPFSILHFDQSMYKINNLTHSEYQRLEEVHKNYIAPICLFYKSNSNISENEMEIYSVKKYPEDIICNEIIFHINSISSYRIVNDIKTKKILLPKYYAIESDGVFVKLTL
jgi:hypothetical protein